MSIFKKLFGNKKKPDSPQKEERSKYMPEEKMPIDEMFTVNFMKNGYKDIPSVDFVVPKSIMLAMVDYNTGKLSTKKGAISW